MPQNFKKYKFKSAGETEQDINDFRQGDIKKIPVGFKTPLEFGFGATGLFTMHYNLADQLSDNFRNLLLTNHGERLVLQNFGANLHELAFELGSENIDNIAMQRIQSAVSNYMPFINLKEFVPFTDNHDNLHVAKRGFSITFDIPQLDVFGRRIDVTLGIAG